MFRYLAIVAVFALSGCATTAGYEKVLDSWVGAQEVDLVRSWGPPVQAYETGGRKFIVYSAKRNVCLPSLSPTYQANVVGDTAYTTAVGGSPINEYRHVVQDNIRIGGFSRGLMVVRGERLHGQRVDLLAIVPSNLAVDLSPFGRWTLRDGAAQRRAPLR